MYGRETRVLLRHYLEQGLKKTELARRLGVSRRMRPQQFSCGNVRAGRIKISTTCASMRPQQFSCGNKDPANTNAANTHASMRPQQFSCGNHGTVVRGGATGRCFNEAAAIQLRKPDAATVSRRQYSAS